MGWGSGVDRGTTNAGGGTAVGSRSRGGGAQLPPRAVEEVTGQPLTGQKPARLSGMGWLRAG